MKTNVIGDKSSFAIEFAEIIPDWGPPEGAAKSGICAIWLAGHKLHEEGNTLYFDGLLPHLRHLVNVEVTTGDPLPATTSANELDLMLPACAPEPACACGTTFLSSFPRKRESREGGFEVTFLDSRLRGNDEVYIEIVINNLFFGEVPG